MTNTLYTIPTLTRVPERGKILPKIEIKLYRIHRYCGFDIESSPFFDLRENQTISHPIGQDPMVLCINEVIE
jgi:hypothetical protein